MPLLYGHTLGTPHLDLPAALTLFAEAGLDGAEIIYQDGYRSAIPESDDGTAAEAAARLTRSLGLRIGCLTPYVTELNSPDDAVREREIRRIEACITTANRLGCPRIRVYGGSLIGALSTAEVEVRWQRLVDALRRLGDLASRSGVVLCIENHFGTMTVDAATTVRLVTEIASPGVGILYDQANLTFAHCEPFETAIDLQAAWIRHVHVKDLVFVDPDSPLRPNAVATIDQSDRHHRSRIIGNGILNWDAIVRLLLATGYDGSFSLEYESRWYPDDLPAPEVGIPESARRLRALVEAALRDGRVTA
jgi:sugar phosphate isomerase/epimerase